MYVASSILMVIADDVCKVVDYVMLPLYFPAFSVALLHFVSFNFSSDHLRVWA